MPRGARAFGLALCSVFAAASMWLAITPARAIPPAAEPRGAAPSPTTAPTAAGPILPYGSPIYLVLDDRIDSGKTPVGTVVRLHLQTPLVVGGVTLAPAGTSDTLTIVSRSRANIGNEDGAVQIHLDPLVLPGRDRTLPLRVTHEYLTIEYTAGQVSTQNVADTVGDIFIPYHTLYHYLRPGHQYVLPPGAVLHAQTELTIDASNPHTIVFSTPAPFESTYDTPHADITALPLYTPNPQRPHPLPKGKPTLPPSPPPAPASPAPSASASTSAGSPAPAAAPSGSSASPGSSALPSGSPATPGSSAPSATPS